METELKELLEKEKNYCISKLTNVVLEVDKDNIYFGENESEVKRTITKAIESDDTEILLFTFRQMLEHNK